MLFRKVIIQVFLGIFTAAWLAEASEPTEKNRHSFSFSGGHHAVDLVIVLLVVGVIITLALAIFLLKRKK